MIRDAHGGPDALVAELLSAGYLAGVPLGRWYPELDDCLLVAVTEKRTRAEIDGLAEAIHSISSPLTTSNHAQHSIHQTAL